MKQWVKNLGAYLSAVLLMFPAFVGNVSADDDSASTIVAIEQHIVSREFDQAQALLSESTIPEFQRDYLRGWLAVKQQDFEQAKAIWLPLWEAHPDKLELGNNLAVALIQLKEFGLAKRVLEGSLNQDERIASALGNLNDLHSYLAQRAYANVFNRIQAQPPLGQWLALAPETISYDVAASVSTQGVDFEREITQALVAWRHAWAAQNVDRYLMAYSDRFVPSNNQSLADWRRTRERNVSRPNFIELQLANVRILPITANEVQVEFDQMYRSNIVTSNTRKMLMFERQDGRWFIIQERVINEG
ncbi:nuclear transport factor 2 family protein [Thiomicrospira sp. ALE5]|uniref:L,D-transpeptidase Cds6 family protein n=1 Tax=Thiomicrospira sp. ALE5 TaxID=748650 RepID=UPI0008E4F9EB|nr:nuclear transport factor 2 family protein [Thiomicrospira sp. ALE5]SFR54470.1 hypothetical protein SAMN03092900_1015 [Thiomicrospira sp. ALE5]